MSNVTAVLTTKLGELKKAKNGEAINFEDVNSVIMDVITNMEDGASEGSVIYKELSSIRDAIEEAKGETVDILNDDGTAIPDAGLQLDAVIKASEDAANDIIDAASEIMEAAPDNEKVQEQAMKIIEKCDFGDISRQRLVKVVSHLDNIETRLTKLFDTLKLERKNPEEKKCADGETSLSGPQLDQEAPSQDDIDAIFDSF